MTTESRTLIELSGIIGIEFTCSECKTRVLFPITQPALQLAGRCPSCNAEWFPRIPLAHPQTPTPLQDFRDNLAEFQRFLRRTELQGGARLELKTSASAPSSNEPPNRP